MIACALGGEGPRRRIRALARIIARLNAHQHAGRISIEQWHRLVAAAITEFREDSMPKPEGLPDGLAEPLMQLWRSQQPITVQLLPRDAWVTLGVIQFASRSPALNADERHMVEQFGRELQRVLAGIDPRLAPYLEMGWDTAHDQPKEE